MDKKWRRSSGTAKPGEPDAPKLYGDEPMDWEREATEALEDINDIQNDTDGIFGTYRYDDEAYYADDSQPRPVKTKSAKSAKPAKAPRGGYASSGDTRSTPVHRYVGDSPNPDPPRRWPLFFFVTLTVVLMFVALNIEQRRQDAQHWAAPSASGVNEDLVVRSIMDVPESLPTQIPQSYIDEVNEAFARTKELITPTPFFTAPPVTPTPQPTKVPLLKKDMQSDYVLQVEKRLVELGYLEADQADGKFDSKTVSAVKAFQDACFLTADGMAGKDTVDKMFRQDAPRPTPEPTRKDEPYVWATAGGTYYHAVKDCSNMKNASEIALSDAKADGKKACPKCDPPKE